MNETHKAIIDSLERRFEAIRDHRDRDSVLMLRVGYANFIGTTPLLGRALRQVILNDKIPRHVLFTFFMEFAVCNSAEASSNEKMKTPIFWDEEVEKKFHIYRELYETAKTGLKEHKAIQRGELEDPLFSYIEGEVAKDTQDYYIIHTELMEALTLNNETVGNNVIVYFDETESDLRVNEIKIPLRRFSDQYHFLRVTLKLWENENEELFFSEITEAIDSAATSEDKKYYNAAYQIRAKVEAKTRIKDIFSTTRQSIKLNQRYEFQINLS